MKDTATQVHREKAGFLHQLKLLLWKNVTLKKRSPLVFLFEISIPLVLFVILLTIRGREHAQRVGISHYKSIPLPSAGILPIVQSFCDDGEGDIYHTPNHRLKAVLSSLQHVWRVTEQVSQSVQIDALQDLPRQLESVLSQGAGDSGSDMGTLAAQLLEYLTPDMTTPEDSAPSSDNLTQSMDSNFLPGVGVNETFEMYASVTNYARQWLNVSRDVHDVIANVTSQTTGLSLESLAEALIFARQFPTPPGVDSSTTKGDKYATILELWNRVQPAFCGTSRNGTRVPANVDVNISRSDVYDRPLSNNQKQYLTMISHYLHSNPKILFAPNNAAAKRIIKSVNETFEMYASVTNYARQWLNVSRDVHDVIANVTSQIPSSIIEEIEKRLRPYFNTSTHNSTAMNNGTMFLQNLTRDVIGVVDKAAVTWLTLISGVDFDVFRGFPTEAELENYFLEQQYHDNVTVIAGLVFENLNSSTAALPLHVRYKVRQNATLTPTTKLVRHQFWYPSPGTWDVKYYHFGFVWIQDLVERAIINLQAGRHVSEPGAFFQRMPYPCWLGDQFVWLIQHVLPLCLMLSWVYTVAMLVQSIVYEKEKRLKEVMKMMGLSCGVHLCAWFITATIQMTITMATVAMMLHFGKVLPYSNPWVVFLFLELFAISSVGFSFMVSSLFSKARLAAACAGIFYFLTYVPYIYVAIKEDVTGDRIDGAVKIAASLFSTTALGLGGKYFLYYELEGVGAQWSNLAVSPRENDNFSLFLVLLMMAVDACLYFLLAWYIENVHPGQFGLPKPWYFPCSKSYWCEGYTETDTCSVKRLFGIRTEHLYRNIEEESTVDDILEADPIGCQVGVEISNLTMTYKGSVRPAVDNLTFSLYEDQITIFLGHNGAGKTTTMSILTGLFPATSGTATVYGRDIRTDMDSIRQSLGMCPQHNVLFDKLTVEEHLWFYAKLKGQSTETINQDTDRMLTDVGILDKRKSLPGSLSGGMRRKLSVAIAFVGGSRLVILDEPTAGVDPYSRRSIWNLLSKYKQGRTILLSTHHMDEAEILGDRIVVISNGRLRCCGSPFYLRNTLGEGYHLHILKADIEDSNQLSTDPAHQFQSVKVLNKVQLFIPHAYILTDNQYELHVVLPLIQKNKAELIALFDMLQHERTDLGIKSFGVSDSSLEEVFIKLTDESLNHNKDHVPHDSNHINSCTDEDDLASIRVLSQRASVANNNETELRDIHDTIHSRSQNKYIRYGNPSRRDHIRGQRKETLATCCSSFTHFRAIITKCFKYTYRNRKSLLTQILLPAAFVSIAMTVALSAPRDNDPPPLTLSPSQYFNLTQPRGNYIPYSYPRINGSKLYGKDAGPRELVSTFRLPSGIGATCILKIPYHSKYDTAAIRRLNSSAHNFKLFSNFFEKDCAAVFLPGIKLDYYVPKVTTVHQSAIYATNTTDRSTKLSYYPTCTCKSDGVGFQCADGGYRNPPTTKLVTHDVLLDISGTDEQLYYLNTNDKYRLHRYGGFSFGTELPYIPKSQMDDLAEQYSSVLKKIAVKHTAQVWFNNRGYHAMPVYLNALNNAILRANMPTSKGNPAVYGITVTNHPMKKTNNILNEDYITGGSDVLMAIFIIMAMSFVPPSFVVFLVHERSIKAKHLQFVSGVNPVVYWLSNYIWDMCNYIIPATCIIGILLAFHIPAYVAKGNFEAVVALFLLYGWSVTPMMYPASFIFHEPSVAYIFLIVINLFTGITCVLTGFMLEMFDYDNHLKAVNDVLKQVFLLFPNYCLGNGLMDIALNQYKNEYYSDTGQYDKIQSPMLWDMTGKKLVAMASVGCVFFVFTILCEYRFFVRCRRPSPMASPAAEEDADVHAERQRTVYGEGRGDMLRLENLTKVYRTRKLDKVVAVNNLTLAIPAGECFGLLGVNGAGKTTTFKMLTGDIRPTSGDAILNSYSVLTDTHSVQENIGYCPQSDAIFDELTPREHLQLYARLRGIPRPQEHTVVNRALKKLSLDRYSDQTSGTLSGGNKRKLSTALSLMGDPPLIYMDEPTSGMDPYSRRFLWDTIRDLVAAGKSVLFTSHSMEECEALCSRLAIMVKGQMKCLGSIQHLKEKYGSGYTIHVTTKSSHTIAQQRVHSVEDYVQKHIYGSQLKEIRTNIMIFEVAKLTQSLADVFRILETLTEVIDVQDYSVNQNDLDSVFVKFAQEHNGDGVLNGDGKTPSASTVTERNENPDTCIDPYSRHGTDYNEPLILIERGASFSRRADDSDDEMITPV